MLKGMAGAGVITLAVILVTGCLHRDVELVYVFPDGFHGVAKIRSNRPTGVTLEARDEGMERRIITLEFPASGVLEIKGESPTLDWYSPSARYAGGKTIPVAGVDKDVAKDVIALRGMGGIIDDEEWYVVGSFDDLFKANKERHAYKYPDRKK